MSPVVLVIVVVAFGYFLGSIPSGLLIGRLLAGVDIRETGSGRTGATNALRSLGAKGFALTFAADAAKAIVAILAARALAPPELADVASAAAAIAAIAGHNWSVYIGFKGGRGVACSFGAMLLLYWQSALVGLVAFAILVAISRYMSLGSLGGTVVGLVVAIVAVALWGEPPALAAFALATAVIVIVQHRDNIQRLLAGTERRIGRRAETS